MYTRLRGCASAVYDRGIYSPPTPIIIIMYYYYIYKYIATRDYTHSPRCSLYMYIIHSYCCLYTARLYAYIGAAAVRPRGKIRSGGCNMAVVCIRHINCSIYCV